MTSLWLVMQGIVAQGIVEACLRCCSRICNTPIRLLLTYISWLPRPSHCLSLLIDLIPYITTLTPTHALHTLLIILTHCLSLFLCSYHCVVSPFMSELQAIS